MATEQQLIEGIRRADAAGDTAAVQALGAELVRIRGGSKGSPALEKLAQQGFQMANIGTQMVQQRLGTKPKMSRGQALVSGVERGVAPIGQFVEKYNPVLAAVNAIQGKGAQTKRAQVRNRMAAQGRQAQVEQPGAYVVGEVLGQTLATAPFTSGAGALLEGAGGALANVAPKTGKIVKAIGATTKTGGMTSGLTKQQIAALPRSARIANLATRAAGGAIAGGLSAGLTGQDVVTGAEFGAGLPIVGNIVGKLGGKAVDLTRMTKLKAGKLIREALGKDADAARAAFSALSPDDQRLARQVLVDAGVEPDTFMALGADVERLRPTEVRNVLEGQAEARKARLAQAAEGGTATEMRAASDLAQQNLNLQTGPLREAALQEVKATNRAVSDADRIAQAARQRVADQSGLARRMTFGAERAETRLGQADDLGDVFNPQAVARERGLAGAMTQRGETAAKNAIGGRETIQQIEDAVAQMAAEGREPLQAAPLSNLLRQQANAEGVRTSSARRALLKLAKEIDGAADANGMLSPYDLYTLRKEASDIVEKFVTSSAQPSTGSKKRAAGLVIGFKNAVDQALGPEFRDYLTQHTLGMQAVNRQDLAAKGAQLAKESPTEFVALMGGERPDIVEGILGKGTKQYDIAGMALADPQRYLALKTAADEIARNNRMAELAQSGRVAANELMGRETPNKLRSLTRMGLSTVPAGRIALEGGEQFVSQLMKPKIGRELAGGFMSGQNALNLMNQYPTATTLAGQISRLPAPALNAIAQIVRGFMTPAETNYSE